jgi:hypothetical protein
MQIVQPIRSFRPRLREETGISGLFWLQPLNVQQRRIREMAAAGLNLEQISTIARMSLSAVQTAVEASS